MSVRIASPQRSSPIDNIVNIYEYREHGRIGLKAQDVVAKYRVNALRGKRAGRRVTKPTINYLLLFFFIFILLIHHTRNTGARTSVSRPEIERRFTRRTCPSVGHVRSGDRPGPCTHFHDWNCTIVSWRWDTRAASYSTRSDQSALTPFPELCPILVAILEATFVSALRPFPPLSFSAIPRQKEGERIGRLDRWNGIRVSVIYREAKTHDSDGIKCGASW